MYQDGLTNQWRLRGLAWALAFMAGVVQASAVYAHGSSTNKCRKAIVDAAAEFEAKTATVLQMCNDAILTGMKSGPCPDSGAQALISALESKAKLEITSACSGQTLANMGFENLSSQCSANGFSPGLPCNEASDCKGICDAASGAKEGDFCLTTSFCSPGTCVGAGECNPVSFCPSVWNDSNKEPFGLTPATDCYFPLTDAASVAQCVTCVSREVAKAQIDTVFESSSAPSLMAVVDCERTVGREARAHLAVVREALAECQEDVISRGKGTCPDFGVVIRVILSRLKLAFELAKKCKPQVSGPVAASIYSAAGRPDPACFDRTVTSPFDAAKALACYLEASANCDDQLGIGESPAICNPNCGNGFVESGETCDDSNQLNDSGVGPLDVCPSSCAVAACPDAGTDTIARVDFQTPGAISLAGLTVLLTYDDARVSIPGTGFGSGIDSAVTSPSFGLTTGDSDVSLRVVALDPFQIGVAPGEAFTATLDRCQGAAAPAAAEFGCMVVDASDLNGASVDGVTCSVTIL